MCVLFIAMRLPAQKTWSLVISSSVELRTLKLTNKAEQSSRPLKGASITLYQGKTVLNQSMSSGSGDFSVLVPPDGDFTIVVSYPGCNAKKFQISTKGVPETFDQEGWEPSFPIGGVIMSKPLYSIDYSALQEPVVRVVFKQKGKVFDDDGAYTDEALGRLRKIKSDEDDLIARFLEAVNAGDVALKKPDCPLAKAMYEKALALIPKEDYPIAQLAKVGDCLVEKERTDKIAAAESGKKQEEEKARQKAKEEMKAKELAQAEKFAKEKEEAKARQKEESEKQRRETDNNAKQALQEEETKKASQKAAEEEQRKKPVQPSQVVDAGQPTTNSKSGTSPKEEKTKHKKTPEKSGKNQSKNTEAVVSNTAVKKESTTHESGVGSVNSKKSRYNTPQVIGTSQYQKLINEADGKFREKDYVRAKVLYTKALDQKPADAYATERLKAIKEILGKGTGE
jgi:hypothetical protein